MLVIPVQSLHFVILLNYNDHDEYARTNIVSGVVDVCLGKRRQSRKVCPRYIYYT